MKANIRDYENKDHLDLKGGKDVCRPEFKKIMRFGKLTDVCYLNMPGDPTYRHCAVVSENIKRRFPKEYLAFTNGDIAPLNGTPIEQMPGIGERLATEMKATGLMTIEDLANLNDQGCRSYLGGIGMRERAKVYLANKKPDETNELKAMVEQQAKQIAEMMEALKPKTAPLTVKTQNK